jgi:hypothetical protein
MSERQVGDSHYGGPIFHVHTLSSPRPPLHRYISHRYFFDIIVCLYKIPSSIVSDRDPVFSSNFWHELFQLTRVKLNMLALFHPL